MRAVRRGWHISAKVKGMSSPNARSMLADLPGDSPRPIIGLLCIHLGTEENFEGQWHLDRDEKPLEEPRLGQWEVIGIALGRLNAFQLEYDHNAQLVSARIVFPHDARFPQPPHV